MGNLAETLVMLQIEDSEMKFSFFSQFDLLPAAPFSPETANRHNLNEHPLIAKIPHNKYTNIRKHQLLPPSAWLIIFSRNPKYP